jgi:hypothetical protein
VNQSIGTEGFGGDDVVDVADGGGNSWNCSSFGVALIYDKFVS